jgi:tetratricopeptide (TPR) repeat protein
MTLVIGDPLYRPFKTPLTSRLALGPTRDYALFSGLVQRHQNAENPAELRQQVQRLAEQRNLPRLIEFLALYAWQSGSTLEAANLLDHAADWFPEGPDRSRTRLYQAEALLQLGNREAAKQALQSLPDHPAAKAMLQSLQ